ncbi:zeta toxin family protein [Staphylococcus sp. MI 10-1553]|nr:zeta toxin family protein [Staphylococcus sp. MI 10-1553]
MEGTLRTVEVPRRTAVSLKSKGYQVELSLIATKPYLSYLSTLLRYEQNYTIFPKSARASPKEYHDNIVNNLVRNLNILENEKFLIEYKYLSEIKAVYMILMKMVI